MSHNPSSEGITKDIDHRTEAITKNEIEKKKINKIYMLPQHP